MSKPIVFVHGMFVTPKCWDGWVERFRAAGYACQAPAWPGRQGSIAELRQRHPDPVLGKLTLPQIVDHYEALIRKLDAPPVLIGHSMGGLIVQLLLARGLGAQGVAIDSAPPQGVASAKWSFLKSNWPVISPFVNKEEPFFMNLQQFCYTFVHTLPPEEQRAVYDQHVVPESRLVGRAALTPAAHTDSRAHPLHHRPDRLDRGRRLRKGLDREAVAGVVTVMRPLLIGLLSLAFCRFG
jgi:pimeloyl-ACP methyl ester carboxylesterase